MRNKIVTFLLAIVALLGGGAYIGQSLGSTVDGQAYNPTSTYSKLGVPTFTAAQTLVSNRQGVLGSVVIAGAVAGAMKFMDATSTTDISSTTLSVFPASAAVGDYQIEAVFTRGLIVETSSGTQPTTTITYR